MQEPEGDNNPDEVQCEKCKLWSHMECLSPDVDWNDPDIHFMCKRCRVETDSPTPSFESGQTIMVPSPLVPDWKADGVLWYPATFVERHADRARKHDEYEFRWFKCFDGTLFDSSEPTALPVLLLQTFKRSRKFCLEIKDVQLTEHQVFSCSFAWIWAHQPIQIGSVRLPHFLDPSSEDHQNPALSELFDAALPLVAEILEVFTNDHPIVAHFNKYFAGKKMIERSRGAGNWMGSFGIVPTPELEEVLAPPLTRLLSHNGLSHLLEPERNQRVMGMGSALLQLLAVQVELKEEPNLNGDLLDDLLDGRVFGCPSDGDLALNAMFAAVASDAVNSGEAAKRMLNFRNQHAIYDEDYRPPTYRRDDASQFKPREAILVNTKRKGDGDINGEKPSKRANRAGGKAKTRDGSGSREKVLVVASAGHNGINGDDPEAVLSMWRIDLECLEGRSYMPLRSHIASKYREADMFLPKFEEASSGFKINMRKLGP
ncbi:hypothetical protein C8J57DRAFT_1478262 [Mycena rebaudengoi]|nr:hypothetical protein C8J57DRAFT_1478262 [Mycena rebaudengoi]